MTYELAKKLKDAGFPQNYFGFCGVKYYWGSNEKDTRVGLNDYRIKPDETRCPTLEELIEACGRNRFGLVDNEASSKWIASKGTEHTSNIYGTGDTLSEAVANLWLALNKK